MISTDLCIIGAGPVGLFAVFEAGLLKMRCHLMDALPQVGGQLSEIYPQKPIYDIPGYPSVNAQELVNNLMKQIEPFKPTFSLGSRVEKIVRKEDNSFIVTNSDGEEVACKAIAIAAGLGSFEPRKPLVENLENFEKGKGVEYMVRNPELFRDKNIIIAGGGNSALDWTMYLKDVAKEVTLVHRNDTFRGALDNADKIAQWAKEGKLNLLLKTNITKLEGNEKLEKVHLTDANKEVIVKDVDYLIPLYGLSPKLGPIADWNLEIDKNQIVVDRDAYETSVPGIFAIGDINTYPGKLKLILCGFHEASLMCQGAFKYAFPDQHLSFKYTTVNGVHAF